MTLTVICNIILTFLLRQGIKFFFCGSNHHYTVHKLKNLKYNFVNYVIFNTQSPLGIYQLELFIADENLPSCWKLCIMFFRLLQSTVGSPLSVYEDGW